MKITILTDNKNSWIIPYVNDLKKLLTNNHLIDHIFNADEIKKGDIMLILACNKILSKNDLSYHKSNVVIHPSKLPKGRGWSPLAWQILSGLNKIPITLFEASCEVDAGDIYLVDEINLSGYELNDQIKKLQGQKTIEMALKFVNNFDKRKPFPQKGERTSFRRRTHLDSELDINFSLEKQFNLLRVVDNERYPAFFIKGDQKYILKIYKHDEDSV